MKKIGYPTLVLEHDLQKHDRHRMIYLNKCARPQWPIMSTNPYKLGFIDRKSHFITFTLCTLP